MGKFTQNNLGQSPLPSNGVLKKIALFGLLMMIIWVYVVFQLDIGVESSGDKSSWGALDPGVLITFFGIVGVLGFIYLRASKKPLASKPQRDTNWICIKGSFMLNPSVQLQLVECNNELLLLSVSESSASLIHTIPKEEWVETTDLVNKPPSQESFSNMIQHYFKAPLN